MRVLGKAVKGSIERGPGASVDRPLLPGGWSIEKEAEAEAFFVASCRREGAVHQAYLPIDGTIHMITITKTNLRMAGLESSALSAQRSTFNPQVLLIDAGCQWDCYASDITRTMPVGNGEKFTPEGRSTSCFRWTCSSLEFTAVHLLYHRILVKGSQRLHIFKSPSSSSLSSAAPAGNGAWGAEHDEEKILASGISSAFFPHGLGRSLGMDVHDVPSASIETCC
ncbi:hypothetical protein BDP27DRAFT_1431907 [Rhodocollybia butyracea]|uniref:Peptidase M24 domain-containing protein n=1 Tax=Rhodocollybia butyracea TaxID=206335 RepID=A0A9P5TXR3_9AGAR|nr:hypothetical protein BDP27DRAFT_1431907 [Rhodocollybia butyracea]